MVMPPEPQDGVLQDVHGLDLDALVSSEEVYNVELATLAWNWRVLSLAADPTTPLLERCAPIFCRTWRRGPASVLAALVGKPTAYLA